MNFSEIVQDYKILFRMMGHEQDLQKVLHQESSEVKNFIDCVRYMNDYMMSPDCREDDWEFLYAHNSVYAIRVFLLDYYGIIELSTDDEKVLYESVKNKTLNEIYDILIEGWTSVEYCDDNSHSYIKAYYLPACWEERMRGLTIDKWASELKLQIQKVYSQKGS